MGMKPNVPISRKGSGHHTYPLINLSFQQPNQAPVATISVPKKDSPRYKGTAEQIKGSVEIAKATLLYLFLNALFFPLFLLVPHGQ